jgi:hypothetical protein
VLMATFRRTGLRSKHGRPLWPSVNTNLAGSTGSSHITGAVVFVPRVGLWGAFSGSDHVTSGWESSSDSVVSTLRK